MLCIVAVVAEELVGFWIPVFDDELPRLAVVLPSLLVSSSVLVIDREENKVALSATDTFPSISSVNLVFSFLHPFVVCCSPLLDVSRPPLCLVFG